jgi:hypothetical protein
MKLVQKFRGRSARQMHFLFLVCSALLHSAWSLVKFPEKNPGSLRSQSLRACFPFHMPYLHNRIVWSNTA